MLKIIPDTKQYKEEIELLRKELKADFDERQSKIHPYRTRKELKADFDERQSKIHPYRTRVLVKDIEKEANVVGYENKGGIVNYFVQFDEELEECYKYPYDTIKVSHSAITSVK